MVQVPDVFIVNSNDYSLTNGEFLALYFSLMFSFSQKSRNVEVFASPLKAMMDINDNRTIIKSFNGLYEKGILKSDIKSLPRGGRKGFTIELADCAFKNGKFTRLPIMLHSLVPQIRSIGLRLVYYYESYISRGDNNRNFASPSYESICSDLGISEQSLIKYNKILEELGLVKIKRGDIKVVGYLYDDRGRPIFDRPNNRYYPQVSAIGKIAKKTLEGKSFMVNYQ